MAQTDDWGGIAVDEPAVKDDWGGVAAPVKDDWGGIEVHETNPSSPAPDATSPLLPAPVGSGGDANPAPTSGNAVAPFVPRSRNPVREGNPIPRYIPTETEKAIVQEAREESAPVVMKDGKPTIGAEVKNTDLSAGEQVTQGIERGLGAAGLRVAEGAARLTGATATADSLGRDAAQMDSVIPQQTTAGKVGSGVGGALALMSGSGLPGMLGIAGTQAVAGGYDAAFAKAKEEGKTEEEARSEARTGAFKGALRSVPELAAYWLLGAGAAKIAAPLVQQASPLVKAAVGGAASTAANVATSTALHGLHGEQLFTPEGLAMDATFGFLAHGASVGAEAIRSEAQVREMLKSAPTESLESAAADPNFRKSSPYNPDLVDVELAERHARALAEAGSPLTAAETLKTTNYEKQSSPEISPSATTDPAAQLRGDETNRQEPSGTGAGANGSADETANQGRVATAADQTAEPPTTPAPAEPPQSPLRQGETAGETSGEVNRGARSQSNAGTTPEPTTSNTVAPVDTPAAKQSAMSDNLASVPTPGESGAKLGPGAANIEEPLASYEPRRFSERFQEDMSIDQNVRDQTGNRYYEPIPNKITVADAEKIIGERGIDEGVRLVRDESFPMEPRVRSTMAQGLIKKLNQSYAEATKAGDPKAQRFLDQAVDTAEYLGELGTRLGQGVQSFAIWSRLTPEGMLVQAKRIVSKARTEFETTNGDAVKEIVDAVNAAPDGDKLKVLIKISETNPVAKKVKGDFEAIIAASKDGKLTKEQFYDKVSKKLGIPTLSPEDIAKITKMAADIEKAPEGFQRDDKTRELLSYLAELKGADASEVPTALFYANILSGYTTQLVNTVDTAINVLSEAAAQAAANPKSAPEIMTGIYQGLLKGIPDAANVLKTGKGRAENKLQVSSILERSKFGEKGGVPINASTPLGRVIKAGLESKPAAILNLWKYPLRAMVASDSIFYNSAKEARARVLAQAIGKSEGLTGDALFSRVDEILHNTAADRTQAKQQAADEGLTGNAATRRASEILEQKRPEDLVSNADEAAGLATYNHDPQGTLGLISSRLSEIAKKVPGGVFVVPFTRIVANVTNRGIDYTPYGYKRAFFGRGGGKGFETPAPVGQEFKVQLVKATAGTVGMTALAMLDAGGVVQVTGSGPSDPNEKKQLQAAGWKPYSVKIGDRYYSYQNTPLGVGLAMVGHYRDAVRYNKLDEKDAQARLIYATTGVANTITSQSFLSGLSDFMEMVNGKGASADGAKRFFNRTVSSIAVPNIIKQINRAFDPTVYQADTITQAVLRDTPAARAVSKPMLNVLGEPVKASSNRFTSEATDDPVWKLIVEKQAWVSTPSKTTKIRNRPITPEEYYKLIATSGQLIKEYIRTNLIRFQSMPAGDVQDAIQKRAAEIRSGVKSRF